VTERVGAGEEIGTVVGRLAEEDLGRSDRARLLGSLGRLLASGARGAGARAAVSGQWLSDLVTQAAPHLPVRDLATLRDHHGGATGDDLAESLVRTASRATAAVGALGGTLSAAHAAAPPTLLAAPLTLGAETLAVVAIELKLVAELHVVFGRAPVGSRAQVATAYLTSWAGKKGLDPLAAPVSLASVLGTAARQQLRSRVARRLGRNLSSLAPFLTGALAAGELNRRETVKLGDALRRDLRDRPERPRRGLPFRSR
jgi:hypothetical protein